MAHDIIGRSVEDHEVIDAIHKMYSIYRIRYPSSLVTADYNMGRANIHVSEDGIITSVTWG